MPITLRNKKLEEKIRAIGGRTGEGPSKVIASAVEAYDERLKAERKRSKEERLARIRAFTSTLPVFTDEERAAMWKEADGLFDYLYDDEDGRADGASNSDEKPA
jgi:hypothetical protein